MRVAFFKLIMFIVTIALFHSLISQNRAVRPDLTSVYIQDLPAVRFIGKKYVFNIREDVDYRKYWEEWFKNDWFKPLESLIDNNLFTDSDAYVSLNKNFPNKEFHYWIGMFVPCDTVVPEGYEYLDFGTNRLGVVWVNGFEPDIYYQMHPVYEKIERSGYRIKKESDGFFWFMERYVDSRFQQKDENGKVTLDICYFIH
jgi:predicted transcriptional regulator YdeE